MNCSTLLLLAMIVMAPVRLLGQLVAGVVPAGYTLTSYSIYLETVENHTDDVATFDVDCDGVDDFRIVLNRRAPEWDIPNRLYLRSLVDSIRTCAADTAAYCSFNHALMYASGQTMSCELPFALQVDTNVVLGDYATFLCPGAAPMSTDSAFIQYEKVTNGSVHAGWILLSFNTMSGSFINPWTEVHAAIGMCQETGIGTYSSNDQQITVHPNPAPQGIFNWSSHDPFVALEVFDMTGRLVHTGAGGNRGQIDLSSMQGTFILICRTTKGSVLTERIVAY